MTKTVEQQPQYQEIAHGKEPPLGLSFDDLIILPRHSDITSRRDPDEVNISTRIADGLEVNAPIMTANMDTITEWEMAQEIALLGGVGVIHRYLSAEEQARQVKVVKERTRTLQDRPFWVHSDAPIHDMRHLLTEWKSGYLLVQDMEGNTLGMVTTRDLDVSDDPSTPAYVIMKARDELITAPEGTSLQQAERIMKQNRVEKLPIVDSEGKIIGVYTRKDADYYRIYPNASRDIKGRLVVGAAIGVRDEEAEVERAHKLVEAGVDFIVVDIAHGDSENKLKMLRRLAKEQGIDVPIVAGNIATDEAAKRLIDEGADSVKVGVGPGLACDTRVVTGVGRAQISAIASVAAVALPQGIGVIADGGMRSPGDLVKALVAGADIGMFGGMFAGTEETPGRVIVKDGMRYKRYEGMASNAARQRAEAARGEITQVGVIYDDRFQQVDQLKEQPPEGREKVVPLRGPAREVFARVAGGVRSGMSYVNAHTIEELREKARFERVTSAGATEQYGQIK